MASLPVIVGFAEIIFGIPVAYGSLVFLAKYKDGEFDHQIDKIEIYFHFFLYVYSRKRTYRHLGKEITAAF